MMARGPAAAAHCPQLRAQQAGRYTEEQCRSLACMLEQAEHTPRKCHTCRSSGALAPCCISHSNSPSHVIDVTCPGRNSRPRGKNPYSTCIPAHALRIVIQCARPKVGLAPGQAMTMGLSRMNPLPRSSALVGRRISRTSYSTWWLYLRGRPHDFYQCTLESDSSKRTLLCDYHSSSDRMPPAWTDNGQFQHNSTPRDVSKDECADTLLQHGVIPGSNTQFSIQNLRSFDEMRQGMTWSLCQLGPHLYRARHVTRINSWRGELKLRRHSSRHNRSSSAARLAQHGTPR